MQTGALGKVYRAGETIIHQGAKGDCIYIIQEGEVEVFKTLKDREIHLAELGEGEFFGEMAVFEKTVRSSSVRAKGQTRVLTVDKKTLLRRMQEDPSLAFRFLEIMSTRLRRLDLQLARMHSPEKAGIGDRNSRDERDPLFCMDSGGMACLVSNPSRLEAKYCNICGYCRYAKEK